MKRNLGVTLLEIVIAMSIGLITLVPIGVYFSQSGNQITKAQNYTFAGSLARRIGHYITQIPLDEIENVDFPGKAIGGSKNDIFFGEMFNYDSKKGGIHYLTESDMPELYLFLRKYDFRYAIQVSSVTFAPDDIVKSVAISIMWKENGKDFMHKSHVYALSS